MDALTEQMRSEGYEITDGPVVGKDGCYGSFVLDPDGNTVRIVA
ncbi:MAG: VOC family protein [Butyricicoccus sp.]